MRPDWLRKMDDGIYEGEFGDCHFIIRRNTRTRTRTYEPRYGHVPGTRKPRRSTKTTWYTVARRVGDRWEHLTAPDVPPMSLNAAIALAVAST